MAVEFGKLYLTLESPTSVTLRKKTGEGSYTDYTVNYCYKTAGNDETFSDEPNLSVNTTIFHLWVTNLSGQSVLWGDKIVHSGTTYTVRRSQLMSREQRYRVTCTQDR